MNPWCEAADQPQLKDGDTSASGMRFTVSQTLCTGDNETHDRGLDMAMDAEIQFAETLRYGAVVKDVRGGGIP